MTSDRDRLIELFEAVEKDPAITCPHYKTEKTCDECKYTINNFMCNHTERMVDYLLENGVIVPPVEVGGEIWVIDREDGEAIDISCVMFLGKSKGCIIATSWINDYDLDETLEFHMNETQNNFDTDLKVYPDEDCFLTKEEAEAKLKEREG